MTTYGMISTYPPTRSGLASFADRLRTALLADHADEVRVVRVGELPHYGDAAEVVAWMGGDHVDAEKAAAALNECDVALIQHDFGVYAGSDGRDILAVADRLPVPSIAVVHTVPADPDPRQREVLEGLMDRVGAIAVMSEAAADRLLAGYAVDGAKIAVIPHGAEVAHSPFTEPGAAASMTSSGRSLAPDFDWAAVSAGYRRLASLLRAEQAQLLV